MRLVRSLEGSALSLVLTPFLLMLCGAPALAGEATGSLEAQLFAAAHTGDAVRIKELIGKGAGVNTPNEKGVPPLLAAAAGGHTAAVTALLDGGADLTVTSRGGFAGYTALHMAAAKGKDEVIRLLLDRGADVNAKTAGPGVPPGLLGETPLVAAVAFHPETVRLLIARGAEVNARFGSGQTPLMRAAMNGASKSIEMLLENGADASLRQKDGTTVLQSSVGGRCFSPEVTRALVKQSQATPEDLNSALLAVTTGAHDDSCLGFAGVVLDSGADVNARTRSGSTPLILAATWGQAKMVDFLLSRGADPTLRNDEGETARKAAITREIAARLKSAETARQR